MQVQITYKKHKTGKDFIKNLQVLTNTYQKTSTRKEVMMYKTVDLCLVQHIRD